MKHALLFLSFSLIATATHAQTVEAESAPALAAYLDSVGLEDCIQLLDQRTQRDAVYERKLGTKPKALTLVESGHRIKCEAIRLRGEIVRLAEETQRLIAAADALDREWETAHQIAPAKFADVAGRDASQRTMRRDVEVLDGTIRVLEANAASLDKEAIRLFGVATEAMNDLRPSEATFLMGAMDAKTQYQLLVRILGLESKPRPT